MTDSISNIAGQGIRQHLTLAWANQRAIAHNIANANTPNFNPTRLELIQKDQADLLSLDQSNGSHLNSKVDESFILKETPVTDFSVDLEVGEMTKNNLFYQTLLETVARRNQMAKSVLEGR